MSPSGPKLPSGEDLLLPTRWGYHHKPLVSKAPSKDPGFGDHNRLLTRTPRASDWCWKGTLILNKNSQLPSKIHKNSVGWVGKFQHPPIIDNLHHLTSQPGHIGNSPDVDEPIHRESGIHREDQVDGDTPWWSTWCKSWNSKFTCIIIPSSYHSNPSSFTVTPHLPTSPSATFPPPKKKTPAVLELWASATAATAAAAVAKPALGSRPKAPIARPRPCVALQAIRWSRIAPQDPHARPLGSA